MATLNDALDRHFDPEPSNTVSNQISQPKFLLIFRKKRKRK
jgi:hypothetical protein